MVNGIQFKVCGLTRAVCAQAAAEAGADFLGFIFYPKSPRHIRLERYHDIEGRLPKLPRVAVTVAPDIFTFAKLEAAGFDYFQIHFPVGLKEEIPSWERLVGKDRLWLAPKIPPDVEFDQSMLDHCSGVLWDAYKKDASVYGGTGQRSDWKSFAQLQRKYPDHRWILAGGISPENAAEAIEETGAKCLDFNSSLEAEPGLKDLNRLAEVRDALSKVLL
ncbi:hypothetical protein [Pelagicoccus sp. SDUM812003]|uniref:phosphoribosylanthranilate isomerase n=1 Tax=Pelagicoccus sp. SDUM812003 TaxID=3041267 RepID=UPI00280E0F9D|nr:hypothetical protein [Pelagicoccus sp. SDUM812003]MDQ8202865.1 hypothetical protein [Pelagicoccus sp. SDUM812003]